MGASQFVNPDDNKKNKDEKQMIIIMNAHEFEYIKIISLVIAAKKVEMKVEKIVSSSMTRSYVQDRF